MANSYNYNYNPYGPWGSWGQRWGWNQGTTTTTPTTTATTTQTPISFPTAGEATTWAQNLPGFQQYSNILGTMSTPAGFQSTMQPYINQMLTQLGRSGLPSSSYADRMIADTLANVYAQQALNVAGGYGNYMTAMAPWAAGYAQYPLNIAQLLQG